MADQRTMAELLRAPTEGYAEAIVVPLILAEQFELKHSVINMMTSDQFFGLEKDNPHDHIRWGSPPVARKRIPAFYSLGRILYKDLLRACPHHGFTELHQLDTFYNALNPADQDSLNAVAGANLLERRTRDVQSANKCCDYRHDSYSQTVSSNPTSASVKPLMNTCGGAHPYYQCLAASGNTFPELKDNIQGYVAAAVVNYNQGSGSLPNNTVANPRGELRAITTRSGIVLDGPSVPTPPPFINQDEDERKMLKALLSNKEKLQELANTALNENSLAVFLKKLPKKLGDPGKFLIPCGFSELKCKALANLAGITIDVFVSVGKFTFPADFVIVDYESDPREFANELALITFPPKYDDDLQFDIESDLKEIEYLLYHDPIKDIDSSLKDSIDQSNLDDNLVDSMPEMFTDEHALDYSSPPLFDEYDDDLFEVESDTENVYDDPFDSNGEKIKESKLLIDEHDLLCDFLFSSKYVLFLSEDFSRVDAFPSTNNEDKGELKSITTRSGLATDGPTIPTPPKSVTLEEDECVKETYTDPDLTEYTIKVPPPPVQKPKPPIQRHFVLYTRDS
nr:reverse transcriptase domain-containing protein [Tanacetum cinerariifolium]